MEMWKELSGLPDRPHGEGSEVEQTSESLAGMQICKFSGRKKATKFDAYITLYDYKFTIENHWSNFLFKGSFKL